jgi:predicted DNA-binding transcriptional regulator AlpA
MHLTETEPLLTVGQVAKMLAMSDAWVRQHSSGLRQPTIPSLKLGSKSVRFSRPAVEAFARSLERPQ